MTWSDTEEARSAAPAVLVVQVRNDPYMTPETRIGLAISHEVIADIRR